MAAELDLVLRDATLPAAARVPCGATPERAPRGEVERLDVGVRGERIDAVGRGLPRGRVEVDCGGALLLPGLLDDHVHYREPGRAWVEGYVTGTSASLRGGATTVGEVQNNPPYVATAAQWRAKVDSLRGRARARALVYGCALPDNLGELRELARAAPAVKLFLAGEPGLEVSDEGALAAIFSEVAAAGGLLLLHAEWGPTVRAGLARLGERAQDFSRARSVEAEVEAVERCLRLCAATGARVHFFHVSSAGACEAIRAAKASSLPASGAACAHYLLFTDEDVAARGAALKCNPSIKGAADRAALRRAVQDGTLDVIESDHAPHPRSEKERSFRQAPSGIASADLFLSLWLELSDEGVLALDQVLERGALGPARLHGLHDRGRIARGALADLVLVEEGSFTVEARDFASKAGVSPYVGRALRRRASKVWVGGSLVFDRSAPEDLAALERFAPPPLGAAPPARGGAAAPPGGCC
jgi:dihydroorotase (multifunctional complex type)